MKLYILFVISKTGFHKVIQIYSIDYFSIITVHLLPNRNACEILTNGAIWRKVTVIA